MKKYTLMKNSTYVEYYGLIKGKYFILVTGKSQTRRICWMSFLSYTIDVIR